MNVMDSTSFVTKIFVVILLASFSVGCLKTREELRGEGRNHTDDVASMQKAAVQDMQRAEKNDSSNRFSEIEGSLREMNGRVDVVENKLGQSDHRDSQTHRQTQDQLTETNRKMALLQEEVVKLEGQVQGLNEQVINLKTAPPVEEKKAAAASKSDKKENSYETAEDHFGKKDWKKAIVSYQKYRDTFPKGKHFAESTYKIGVCFQELGLKDEARTFFEEVMQKFVSSPEARRAKIRLKKL